jgi:hypothetical protein
MPEHDLFRIFVSRLNKLSIPYMITGAVASIIYGEPRLTNDIDLVINMKSDSKRPRAGTVNWSACSLTTAPGSKAGMRSSEERR